jgi:hypothetical protein
MLASHDTIGSSGERRALRGHDSKKKARYNCSGRVVGMYKMCDLTKQGFILTYGLVAFDHSIGGPPLRRPEITHEHGLAIAYLTQ